MNFMETFKSTPFIMLTRARSLFSRVFSFDTSTPPIRLDETFDNIDDSFTDDNDSFSESENDESTCSHSSIKHDINSHEKTKQNRLINTMQIAISRTDIESIKHLLNNSDIEINHRDQYGMSYIEHAILIGHFEMVDLLIRYGCDLYQGNSNGHSYLYVAIEITTNKSFEIIRLLLESDCSCLYLIDIISLTSLTQIIYINSKDFLLLNRHLLCIFKYQISRMELNDILNLINYLIITNLLLGKNDEYYGIDSCTKILLNQFNKDYISLFMRTFGTKYALKLEDKLKTLQKLPSSLLIPLTIDDIQPYINRIMDLKYLIPELKHLCRLLIRQNLTNLKSSTIATTIPTVQLQDYLLYTPI